MAVRISFPSLYSVNRIVKNFSASFVEKWFTYHGPYGFWKVMEFDTAIFQDLKVLEKRGFQNNYGKVVDFCLGQF